MSTDSGVGAVFLLLSFFPVVDDEQRRLALEFPLESAAPPRRPTLLAVAAAATGASIESPSRFDLRLHLARRALVLRRGEVVRLKVVVDRWPRLQPEGDVRAREGKKKLLLLLLRLFLLLRRSRRRRGR